MAATERTRTITGTEKAARRMKKKLPSTKIRSFQTTRKNRIRDEVGDDLPAVEEDLPPVALPAEEEMIRPVEKSLS